MESYIYEMRDKATLELNDFFTDDVRASFLASLDDTEQWLYSEEGEEAQKSVFVEKLNALKAVGDAATRRLFEFEHRDTHLANLANLLATYEEFVQSQDPKFAHIDTSKRETVSRKCQEVQKWLSDAQAKQERLSKCDDPFLTLASIDAKCKELSAVCEPVMRTPKPVEKPKPADGPAKAADGPAKAAEGAAPESNVREESADTEMVPTESKEDGPAQQTPAQDEMMSVD